MARYALVIGISTYQNFRNLPKAAIDAEAVASYLERHQYQVTRLPTKWVSENQREIDPTQQIVAKDVATGVNDFITNRAKQQQAIIYIAGHGFQIENPLTGEKTGYLATSDSDRDGNYAIKFVDLRTLLGRAELSSLNVWMDCCYAGGLIESGQLLEPLKVGLQQQANACLIAACREFERAPEGATHGIFTAALLQGLGPEQAQAGRILSTHLLTWITEALDRSGQEVVHVSKGQPIVLIEGLPQPAQPRPPEPSVAPGQSKPFILPQKDISTFTGREEALAQMEDLLLNNPGQKFCRIMGLAGSGGIGKSALACHFATVHRERFPDGVIGLRVDGKDVNTIAREFARRAGSPVDPEADLTAEEIMQDVLGPKHMLLIFDNADEADIQRLLPGGSRCGVIVTTRKRDLPFSLGIAEGATIDLPLLSEADALTLLKKILGESRVEEALDTAKELVRLVGNLPLALQVMGGTLRGRRHRSLADYGEALAAEGELLARLRVGDDQLPQGGWLMYSELGWGAHHLQCRQCHHPSGSSVRSTNGS
jgi:hypothetical protein